MSTLRQAADEFLAQRRIAVAGVSRDAKQPANLIYRRLRDSGHEVFAVNPNAEQVEGDRAYAAVTTIPGGVDGVVIVTTPEAAEGVVVDCVSAGVPRVWLHRGPWARQRVGEGDRVLPRTWRQRDPRRLPEHVWRNLRPRPQMHASDAAAHPQDPGERPGGRLSLHPTFIAPASHRVGSTDTTERSRRWHI